MKRKVYTEKLLLSLTPELNNDLHKFCNKREIEVSSTIRAAIDDYISNPDNMSNKEIINKLNEMNKNEPIVEVPFEIPEEFITKENKRNIISVVRLTIPKKLESEINVFKNKVRLNFDKFCMKGIIMYINKIKRDNCM